MNTKGDSSETEKDGKATDTGSQVHSANSWETADLGDKQRNEKFLRLMGAGKKEHHGKIVIGDHKPAHQREKREEQHLADDLEEQYAHSLEYRLAAGRKGHLGLGFHPESEDKKVEEGVNVEESGVEAKTEEGEEKEAEEALIPEPTAEESKDAGEEGDKSHKKEDKSSREKDERKRESSDDHSEIDAKKMKFVSSSS